jgi:hypothetical protein
LQLQKKAVTAFAQCSSESLALQTATVQAYTFLKWASSSHDCTRRNKTAILIIWIALNLFPTFTLPDLTTHLFAIYMYYFFFSLWWRAPQQMLRTHHSLKAFCATPMMKMSSFFFYQFLQLMEHQWNEIDRGKPTTRGKTCLPVPLCPPQISHGLDLGSNPGIRGDRPATNRLSHGTANFLPWLVPIIQTGCFLWRTMWSWLIGHGCGGYLRGTSPQGPGYDHGPVQVGFVMDKVALGLEFLRAIRLPPLLPFHQCFIRMFIHSEASKP